MKEGEIKKVVRKNYADIAKKEGSCCIPTDSCCGGAEPKQFDSQIINDTSLLLE